MPKQKDIHDLVKQFNSFLNMTIVARAESERDQNYDDHHQWSSSDKEKLDARDQPPVVVNRLKTKVNLLTGIQTRTRTQPRALARTPQHQDGADAITEGLRYISDNTNFKTKSSRAFRDQVVPGYGGGIIEFDKRGDVAFTIIPWDRYYFDPHSRELDFSDKTYDGIVLWMDTERVIQRWPDSEIEVRHLLSSSSDETFDDKPHHWVDEKRRRLRIAQHFYLENDVWMMAFITEGIFLEEPVESPFLDEFGDPDNPIEMQTAYIDRELQRYGEVRGYIWLQDEINHRRSRFLYAGSVTRTMGVEGAVPDVNAMKQELAKADGHIVVNQGFEDKFEILENKDISENAFLLMQEAKQELDEIGANPALGGRGASRSGRQDQIQQQAGQAQLASLYDGHKDFENRVYRQFHNRMKQSWKAEKWVRVTDDPSNLEWVGLNHQVTNQDLLMEAAEAGNQDAPAILQQMLQNGDPRLQEVAEVRNNVAEIDVDIIFADSPDTHTLRQETAELMLALAERYGPDEVPFAAALEFLDIPNKDSIKKLLTPDPQRIELQNIAQQLDIETKQAELAAKNAKTQKDLVDAQAVNLENQLLIDKYPNIVADRDLETQKSAADLDQKRIETARLAVEPITSTNINT